MLADLSEFSLLLVGNSYPLPISSSPIHISSEELCIHFAGPAISNTKCCKILRAPYIRRVRPKIKIACLRNRSALAVNC